MSERTDYTRRLIFKHYRNAQKFPAALNMHPQFFLYLRSEPESALHACRYIKDGYEFEGIPIIETTDVHAVEVVA